MVGRCEEFSGLFQYRKSIVVLTFHTSAHPLTEFALIPSAPLSLPSPVYRHARKQRISGGEIHSKCISQTICESEHKRARFSARKGEGIAVALELVPSEMLAQASTTRDAKSVCLTARRLSYVCFCASIDTRSGFSQRQQEFPLSLTKSRKGSNALRRCSLLSMRLSFSFKGQVILNDSALVDLHASPGGSYRIRSGEPGARWPCQSESAIVFISRPKNLPANCSRQRA